MTDNAILGWTELAESENNPFVRVNEMGDRVTDATQETIDIDTTAGGTIVVGSTDYVSNFFFRLTGTAPGAITLQLPDGKRLISIENNCGQACTVDTTTGSSVQPSLANGARSIFYSRGTEIRTIADTGTATGALLADGSVNPTSGFNWADQELKAPVLRDYGEHRSAPSSASGTLTLDFVNGPAFEVTLTEDVTTLNLNNPPASGTMGSITLIVIQDGTGGWAITWPGSVIWPASVTPTLTSDPGAIDIFVLLTTDGGTTWYGMTGGQDFG